MPSLIIFFPVSFFWFFSIYILPSASLCRVFFGTRQRLCRVQSLPSTLCGKTFAECNRGFAESGSGFGWLNITCREISRILSLRASTHAISNNLPIHPNKYSSSTDAAAAWSRESVTDSQLDLPLHVCKSSDERRLSDRSSVVAKERKVLVSLPS
jgi:hypothetical protein